MAEDAAIAAAIKSKPDVDAKAGSIATTGKEAERDGTTGEMRAAVPGSPMDPKSVAAKPTAIKSMTDKSIGKAQADSAKPDDRGLTGAFLAAALEREKELDAMALQIDSRKRELQVAEKRVADQIVELTTQRKALAAAFGQADETAEEEAMQLVAIYEKMKPKQAAQIFDQMPPEVGAGFVRRMRQTSSAQIMAKVDPPNSYALRLLPAGRARVVRTQCGIAGSW